jgi:hypothetical protein
LVTITKDNAPLENFKSARMIDERLQKVNISKGLIESLMNAGFTIEIIINSQPSDIAQVLGIDYYVAQIIYQETSYYWMMNN